MISKRPGGELASRPLHFISDSHSYVMYGRRRIYAPIPSYRTPRPH